VVWPHHKVSKRPRAIRNEITVGGNFCHLPPGSRNIAFVDVPQHPLCVPASVVTLLIDSVSFKSQIYFHVFFFFFFEVLM
jgi:hypothetical protein